MDYSYTIITLLIEHGGYPALSIISKLSRNLYTLCYTKRVEISRIAICFETEHLLNKYKHFKLVSDSYNGQKVEFYGGKMYDAPLLVWLDKLDIASIEYITYNDYCILNERANLYGAKIMMAAGYDRFNCFSYVTNDKKKINLTFTLDYSNTIYNYIVNTCSLDYLLRLYGIDLGNLKLNNVYYDFSKNNTVEFIKLHEYRQKTLNNKYSKRYKYDKFCQHIDYYDTYIKTPKFDLTNVKSNIILLTCENSYELLKSDKILKIYLSNKTKILRMSDNYRMKIKIKKSSPDLVIFTTQKAMCNTNPVPKGVKIIYLHN